jgi:hypothetical protein
VKFAFLVALIFGLGGFSSAAFGALPTPSDLLQRFKETQNENQRFQVFNDLDGQVEAIADSSEVRKYLEVIGEMIEYSSSKNDSSWVPGKGRELRQKISGIKISRFVSSNNIVPIPVKEREEFIFYFSLSSEQTQFSYLSQSAPKAVLDRQELQFLRNSYDFFSELKKNLHNPVDYISNSLNSVLNLTALLVGRKFKEISFDELKLWCLRMTPEGHSKLMDLMENELYPGPKEPNEEFRKIAMTFKLIHAVLFEKFKHDPFNEWQFNRPLALLKTLILKYVSNSWPVHTEDFSYAIENSPNPSLVLFSDSLADNIVRRTNITESQGRALLPAFELLKEALIKRGLNSDYFKAAYSILQRSQMKFDEIEGRYRINHPFFGRFVLLNKNGHTLVAGINRDDRNVSILFENIDEIDPITGQFVTGTVAGDAHHTLKFKMTGKGTLAGCLGEVCFTGERVEKFPHYIQKLDKDQSKESSGTGIKGVGFYRGPVELYNGTTMFGDLEISSLHDKYAGGIRFTNGIFMSFADGLKVNKRGIVYIAGVAYNVRAMHQFRGFVNSRGQFEGVWISTNIGKVAKFSLTKTKR